MSDKNDPEENRNEKKESAGTQAKDKEAPRSPVRPPRAVVLRDEAGDGGAQSVAHRPVESVRLSAHSP